MDPSLSTVSACFVHPFGAELILSTTVVVTSLLKMLSTAGRARTAGSKAKRTEREGMTIMIAMNSSDKKKRGLVEREGSRYLNSNSFHLHLIQPAPSHVDQIKHSVITPSTSPFQSFPPVESR